MSFLNQCNYCYANIDNDNYLDCRLCKNKYHKICLKLSGTPGDFYGDVFFRFTCANCTDNGKEEFEREHLSWVMLIILAIYHLTIHSNGLSRQGFFHWRQHIANFIERNWNFLMQPNVKRRKIFMGSISGSLSQYSDTIFQSGFSVLGLTGWWKLKHNKTPKAYLKFTEQIRKRMKIDSTDRSVKLGDTHGLNFANALNDDKSNFIQSPVFNGIDVFSRTLPYMGRPPRHLQDDDSKEDDNSADGGIDWDLVLTNHYIAPTITVDQIPKQDKSQRTTTTTNLNLPKASKFKKNNYTTNNMNITKNRRIPHNIDINDESRDADGDDEDDDDDFDGCDNEFINKANNNNNNIKSTNINHNDNNNNIGDHDDYDDNGNEYDDEDDDYDDGNSNIDIEHEPRIVKVTNFQEDISEHSYVENINKIIPIPPVIVKNEPIETDTDSYSYVCEKSLFTKTLKRPPPWEVVNDKNDNDDEDVNTVNNENCYDENVRLMDEGEELNLSKKLQNLIALENKENRKIPPWIRRFYRKLHLRKLKKNLSKPIFDFDNEEHNRRQLNYKKSHHYLDRYYRQQIQTHLICTSTASDDHTSFHARLVGATEYELFQSPHTGRTLHPFIYRNSEIIPNWIKMLLELQYKVNKTVPKRASVDFCYVRPHHIAAVNALLQQMFWPAIDMSDALSYPDYSVVAIYKKLIVGCGFLIPDACHNEAYISFLAVRPGWQRAGIASFMLYHLTQTCMGKDITLHVSATNPGICLYQQFGFKIEEVILDFYDKYLPEDSPHSRHALFLRMKR